MKEINEGLFKDKYQRYKDAVIGVLKTRGISALALGHYLDEYCRDFFTDNISADNCAASIAEDMIAKEKATVSEAMRIMREHGYRVKPYKK